LVPEPVPDPLPASQLAAEDSNPRTAQLSPEKVVILDTQVPAPGSPWVVPVGQEGMPAAKAWQSCMTFSVVRIFSVP
tara:strand:- start:229 stop:459 length:231 start_codon:yes stop_codon:yes gene_type:complete